MKKLIISLIGLLMISLVIAQVTAPTFPSTFTMSLPQLPAQQSQNQIMFNCPYDTGLEHRITNVYSSDANATHITIEADVQYWTQERKCAGSKHFRIIIPIGAVSTPTQLANRFVSDIRTEFLTEAQSNRQRSTPQIVIGTGT